MVSKALLQFRQRAKERQNTFEKDFAVFPFWNIPFDGSSTLRLIPFEDELTQNFWTEKKTIRMNFVDPNDESKLVRFEAPCYEMYAQDQKCPILGPVRDLYAEAKELENAGEDTGRRGNSRQSDRGAHSGFLRPLRGGAHRDQREDIGRKCL